MPPGRVLTSAPLTKLWAVHKPLCGAATEVFQQVPIFPFELEAYGMSEEVKASFLAHLQEHVSSDGPSVTWEVGLAQKLLRNQRSCEGELDD